MRRFTGMMTMAVMAALLASGCGTDDGVSALRATPETAAQSATLTVTTHMRVGPRGVLYIEGALPQVQLVAPDGQRIKTEANAKGTFTFEDLEPGEYRIDAALRPCDGNCGYLDGPTAACTTSVRVAADLRADADWVIGKPCQLTTT